MHGFDRMSFKKNDIIPKGYILSWKGSIIRLDIKVWALSPSLGKRGSQTLIPWAPQYNQRASVR